MDKELLQKLTKILDSQKLGRKNNIFSTADKYLEIIWGDIRRKFVEIVEKLDSAMSFKDKPIQDMSTALDALFLVESEHVAEELVDKNALKSFLESLNKYAYECSESIDVQPEGKII